MKSSHSSAHRRPLRVAYDILRMSAGGRNGGVKTHHHAFLRHFAEQRAHEIELIVFCQAELVPELTFLGANPYNQIHVVGDRAEIDFRDGDPPSLPLHFWPEARPELLVELEVDALYAGFGVSELHSRAIPQVSLLVDALHKDLPKTLPAAVVEHREKEFQAVLAQAARIQTNSDFCIESLQRHYELPPEKLFRIYLPLHRRFDAVERGPLPAPLGRWAKQYLLYPANYWPHKNHQTALVAFRKAVVDNPQEELFLALTGAEYDEAAEIRKTADRLGIGARLAFLGKLPEADFKAVWENARALFFPTLYEGFGIPLLEALYFQKPIYASDLPVIREIVKDYPIYFNPREPLDIARALCQPPQADQAQASEILHNYQLDTEAQRLLEALYSCSPDR